MGGLGLGDALALCVVIAERDPTQYQRAATRWLTRFLEETAGVSLEETQLVTAALNAMPTAPELARPVLRELVRTRQLVGRSAERPFQPASVAARAEKSWKSHGLERVTLHECRHAFSTFLDAAGVWPTRADRYMGHADHSTPGRYRHQLDEHYASDAKLLDDYLTGAQAGAQGLEAAPLSQN